MIGSLIYSRTASYLLVLYTFEFSYGYDENSNKRCILRCRAY